MDRLNLNGDSANAIVLQKRLRWAGLASQIVSISDEAGFLNAIKESKQAPLFVLIGHGSMAAMNSISNFKAEFVDLIDSANKSGGGGLVIGSSYEWLVPHQKGVRQSEFAALDVALPNQSETVDVFGYVNSNTDLKNILWDGNVLFTRLHGPVLAKSPGLADYFCGLITGGQYVCTEPTDLAVILEEARAVARGERD
jgi:CobQ-like glutamine amidotransferase family enzyme